LFDPQRQVTIDRQTTYSCSDFSQYQGLQIQGWPVMTIARGQILTRDGLYVGPKQRGQYLSRQLLL